jgi:hypothetical protein
MQTVILEIDDEIKDVVLSFLRILPSNSIKILEGDTSFTAEDAADYAVAIAEKKAGESVSLASLKKKYGV